MQWVIRTDRLGLRRLGAADLPALRRMHWLDAERVLSRSLAEYERIGHAFWAVVLRESGEFAGICGLLEQVLEGQPEVEVGYHLIQDYHGRGIATEAARGVMEYAFHEVGAHRLVSLIEPHNLASTRVAEKNGLRHERDAVFRDLPVMVFVAVATNAAKLPRRR